MQPGSVISPEQKNNDSNEDNQLNKNTQTQQDAAAVGQPETSKQSPKEPTLPDNIESPSPVESQSPSSLADFATSGFYGDELSQNSRTPVGAAPKTEVTWTASEYIAHDRPVTWYLALALAVVAAALVVYLVTRDRFTFGVIVIAGLLFGIFAARKPQVLQYTIEQQGLIVDQKHYKFEEFRSFSIYQEGSLQSIFFWPTKRFMPGFTAYFPPEQSEEIIGVLSQYLPLEERKPEAIDRLMQHIRF